MKLRLILINKNQIKLINKIKHVLVIMLHVDIIKIDNINGFVKNVLMCKR